MNIATIIEERVPTRTVCAVVDGMQPAIGKLNYWTVKEVVERHVRAAREELLRKVIGLPEPHNSYANHQ